jgi:hypothetical protein
MDIDMPEDLKRIMSRQAGTEREKRATITKAEGDRLAAENLAAAAATMLASPGAMQLRTLQTIDGLGPTASNTVVLAVPIEIMQLAQRFSQPAPEACSVEQANSGTRAEAGVNLSWRRLCVCRRRRTTKVLRLAKPALPKSRASLTTRPKSPMHVAASRRSTA